MRVNVKLCESLIFQALRVVLGCEAAGNCGRTDAPNK
jgi:hypothetical protein